MVSLFDLSSILKTIDAASTRVLPDVIDNFSLQTVNDTIIALNPAVTAFWLTIVFCLFQMVVTLMTRSAAWNDRLWTIIPPIYAFLYAIHPVISQDRRTNSSLDLRLSIMSLLVIVWGSRLTYNAVRRGVFSYGYIDHRYNWFRTKVNNWFLFWFVYLSGCWIFTILLAFATSPLYFAWIKRGAKPPLNKIDFVGIIGMCFSLFVEALADNQQHKFQTRKAEWRKQTQNRDQSQNPEAYLSAQDMSATARRDLIDGFLQSGLFAFSRHPNFFAEISTWWFFYLFSVSASGRWINWTVLGAIQYTLLFQLTTWLTEHMSSARYPAYVEYRKRVPMLIPNPFNNNPVHSQDEGENEKKAN